MVKDNNKKYKRLRQDYPFFIYEDFVIENDNEKLIITFHFNLADKFFFSPKMELIKGEIITDILTESQIECFVFNIGMVELISYWKAACPPVIIIKPYKLDDRQIEWWKKLYFNGLGEFFYLNQIKPGFDEFVKLISNSEKVLKPFQLNLDCHEVLIPVGGGKDSIVTLELLKNHFSCVPFMINPLTASIRSALTAGFDPENLVEVRRSIHPQLLVLNDLGFLNGHTPFSALVAFISIFVAASARIHFVALSNESSANEPTESFSGANHQYSKSFAFEKDFREYVENYISPNINYFSFLRPLSEFAIAGLFSKYEQYYNVFKSCNVGSKTDSWCGNCSKCLFTFIILSPYLSNQKLMEIFGSDLLNNEKMMDFFNELTGITKIKPFECVGTIDEVNLAVVNTIKKRKRNLPVLLNYYISTANYSRYKNVAEDSLTTIETSNHYLNDDFMKILTRALNG